MTDDAKTERIDQPRLLAATLLELGRTHRQAYPAQVAGYLIEAGAVIGRQADRIAALAVGDPWVDLGGEG